MTSFTQSLLPFPKWAKCRATQLNKHAWFYFEKPNFERKGFFFLEKKH